MVSKRRQKVIIVVFGFVLALILAIILSLITFYFHPVTQTVYENMLDTILFSLFFMIGGFLITLISQVLRRIGKRFGIEIQKARDEELKREDDVLLQAVAFSQSVLFVYLSFFSDSDHLMNSLKIMIPTVAVIFYCIRAWAKIKDNSRWRYYSVYVLFLVILSNVMAATKIIVPLIYLGDLNAKETLITPFIWGSAVSGVFTTIEIFKKRYGV